MINLDELVALGQLVTRTEQLSDNGKAAILGVLSKEVNDCFTMALSELYNAGITAIINRADPATYTPATATVPAPPVSVSKPVKDPEIFGRHYKDGIKRPSSKPRQYPNRKVYAPAYHDMLYSTNGAMTAREIQKELQISSSACSNMLGKFKRAGFIVIKNHGRGRAQTYSLHPKWCFDWSDEHSDRYREVYYDKNKDYSKEFWQ